MYIDELSLIPKYQKKVLIFILISPASEIGHDLYQRVQEKKKCFSCRSLELSRVSLKKEAFYLKTPRPWELEACHRKQRMFFFLVKAEGLLYINEFFITYLKSASASVICTSYYSLFYTTELSNVWTKKI